MSGRKIIVSLEGQDGHLRRHEIDVPECADPDAYIDDAIQSVIGRWILSPGDSIRIAEGGA